MKLAEDKSIDIFEMLEEWLGLKYNSFIMAVVKKLEDTYPEKVTELAIYAEGR